ncbi:hypothetical protein [Bradyrhizobium sp. WSM3983]|uniref:hypothetical protein n=1 Tax=Bradyrhizobium sp. WSM3983 TaxID=1038867 RepID=UPI0012EBF63E|nr:hypothetical protein [Bradyrhizobium sp. WSM3983]
MSKINQASRPIVHPTAITAKPMIRMTATKLITLKARHRFSSILGNLRPNHPAVHRRTARRRHKAGKEKVRRRQQIGADKAHKTKAFERQVHSQVIAARLASACTTSNVSGIPASRFR